MRYTTIAVLMLGALALTACGRKGPLELPPETPQQAARAAKQQNQPDIQIAPNDKPIVFDGSGDGIEAGPAAQGQNSGGAFFLDALIQ